MTGGRFKIEHCRNTLERVGKLLRVGRHPILHADIHEYVKNSPTKIKTADLCKKFGCSPVTALGILNRYGQLDRVFIVKPRSDKDIILKLTNGEPMTAYKLSALAYSAGIVVSPRLCRDLLTNAGLLAKGNPGRCKYPHIYKFVKSNPPISAPELARKFMISPKTADNILRRCTTRAYKKTIFDVASELKEPMFAHDFMKLTGCFRNTAYVALARAGNLKRKISEPKPKAKTEPKPPPPKPEAKAKPTPKPKPVTEPPPPPSPPKPRPQQTRTIASMFEAWKEKNL